MLERVQSLRVDRTFLERLRAAAQAAEKSIYPPSPHVEEQLYERGFPPTRDKMLMTRFHAAPWEERLVLARQFADERHRRLVLRVLYIERPDLLDAELLLASERELRKRLMAPTDAGTRWRSITTAQREAEALIATDIVGDDRIRQTQYLHYLSERTNSLEFPGDEPASDTAPASYGRARYT